MFEFKDFNITTSSSAFTGKKIDIETIKEEEIHVLNYKIEQSKYPKENNDKCVHIQIEYEGNKRVFFTSSMVLMNQLEQVPKEKFPFKTVIKKQDKSLVFT
jgi:hypothetical protein